MEAQWDHDAGSRSGESGAMLVEVMIGSVILVVALAAFMMVATQLGALRKGDDQLSYAFTACRNALEEVRALPVTSVLALDGIGFDVEGPVGPGVLRALPGDADGLPGTISVLVEDTTPDSTLYRVTATVDWQGANGRQRFALQTLVGARP